MHLSLAGRVLREWVAVGSKCLTYLYACSSSSSKSMVAVEALLMIVAPTLDWLLTMGPHAAAYHRWPRAGVLRGKACDLSGKEAI